MLGSCQQLMRGSDLDPWLLIAILAGFLSLVFNCICPSSRMAEVSRSEKLIPRSLANMTQNTKHWLMTISKMCYIDVLRTRIDDSVFYLARTWFQSPIFILAIRFGQEQSKCRLLPVRLLDIDVGDLGPRLGGVRGPGGHLCGLASGLQPPLEVWPVTGAREYHLGHLHGTAGILTNVHIAIRFGDKSLLHARYINLFMLWSIHKQQNEIWTRFCINKTASKVHLLKFSDESKHSFARCNLKWSLEERDFDFFFYCGQTKARYFSFQIQGF